MIMFMGTKIQYLCSMDYQACLSYLYTKLPLFSRTGAAALKLNLNNTISICESLDHPEHKFRSIHVAGTNGKGSVSHMLASILQEQGYKTGLYTSPHLNDFRERIRINGKMIPEENVIAFTKKMMPLIDQIEPSFFEVTVGMAFDYFATEKVDFAVIETGLGGRLDSTNVITPMLSVITNIGFDHMAILGNTLEQIASEKAGIIKQNTPVVIGKRDQETDNVFIKTAASKNAELVFAEDLYEPETVALNRGSISVSLVRKKDLLKKIISTPLAGLYQLENIRTVLTAIDMLKNLTIHLDDRTIKSGIQNVIQNTGLQGRWEMISQSPMIILDVAHNPAGIQQLVEQLKRTTYHKLYVILGVSKDKDAEAILNLLPKNAVYGFTQAALPRAMAKEELSEMAGCKGLKGICFASVNDALIRFKGESEPDDLIIVCGSIFTVGEVNRDLFD
jgi:dihydrofolate synthase/folylpolyglutamate synthase